MSIAPRRADFIRFVRPSGYRWATKSGRTSIRAVLGGSGSGCDRFHDAGRGGRQSRVSNYSNIRGAVLVRAREHRTPVLPGAQMHRSGRGVRGDVVHARNAATGVRHIRDTEAAATDSAALEGIDTRSFASPAAATATGRHVFPIAADRLATCVYSPVKPCGPAVLATSEPSARGSRTVFGVRFTNPGIRTL